MRSPTDYNIASLLRGMQRSQRDNLPPKPVVYAHPSWAEEARLEYGDSVEVIELSHIARLPQVFPL